jgi:hypothetical protein
MGNFTVILVTFYRNKFFLEIFKKYIPLKRELLYLQIRDIQNNMVAMYITLPVDRDDITSITLLLYSSSEHRVSIVIYVV